MAEDWVRLQLGMRLQIGVLRYLRLFRLVCLPCIHYMHLDGYFSVIWKAVTLLILLTKNPLLYIVLLLGMRIMH